MPRRTDTPPQPTAHLTPALIATRLGLKKTDAVLAWINRGELVAVNVSSGDGRPTWRIDPGELDAFLARRRSRPAPVIPRRRRKQAAKVTDYF